MKLEIELPSKLDKIIFEAIYSTLALTDWNRAATSRALGMATRTLTHYMSRMRSHGYEIAPSKYGSGFKS